ncbi:hypothetical protein HETIRDRAFT_455483 [Heterobasidion irregulare TC 32-1]|uniref:Uncharacterized protein n=1 Tax=Heterobasidion irregulare (strain TC 32-1) TaxID=747525 RepID=W4JRU7_HETIT|nr:uncharacterized protein HETIRDRAFT_455483 [Heterobasidion irregulare TC 32-1]ETW75810.1 hypothetical protein HETIRDRAFT_455483 [Heterobasidion irregulare TC 32-1]
MSSNARAASLSTAPTLQSTVQITPEKKIQSVEAEIELDLPLREDEDSVSMDGAPVVAPEIRPSLTVLVSPQPKSPAPTRSYQSSTSSGRDDDKIHGLQNIKAVFNDRSVTPPKGSPNDSLKPLLTPKKSATNTPMMFSPPLPRSPHNPLSGRVSKLSHHLYSDSARATSPAASLAARSYHDHVNNSTLHTPPSSPGVRQTAPSSVLNRLPTQVATSPTPSHVQSASVMNLLGQQLKSPSSPASANSPPGVNRSSPPSPPLSVPRSRERLEQSDQTAKTVSHLYQERGREELLLP